MSRVFRKTPRGVEAFANKESGLNHAQRALLVLVDGKRNASQLRKFGASFGNVNGLLGELYGAALIELDPAYVSKMTALQAEIAKENAALPSALAVETVVAGVAARSANPSTVAGAAGTPMGASKLGSAGSGNTLQNPPTQNPPTVSKPIKRDLRELAMLAKPDPPAAAASAPMSAEFDAAKRFAISFIQNTLGNSGTPLRFALDRADTPRRLNDVIDVAVRTVREMKGVSVAADFRRGYEAALGRSN